MQNERGTNTERRKCALHNYMEERDKHIEERLDEAVPSKWFLYIISGVCAFAIILGGLAYKSVEARNNQQDEVLTKIQESTFTLHTEILQVVKENQNLLKGKKNGQ